MTHDSSTNPPLTFEYNPCSGFKCVLESIAASCLIFSRKEERLIGIQNTSTFVNTPDNTSIVLRYTNDQWRTDVLFTCKQGVDGDFLLGNSNTSQNTYEFQVYTKYACLSELTTTATTASSTTTTSTTTTSTQSSTGTVTQSTRRIITFNPRPYYPSSTPAPAPVPIVEAGLGVGGILLLVVLLVLVLYLILGALLNAVLFEKRGLEILPNATFWVLLCYNVLLGGKFIAAYIQGRMKKNDYISFSINTNSM